MDEVKITEDYAKQIVWVETSKRKEKIKIFVPLNGLVNWKITYEDGRGIPELGGIFLTKRDALKALNLWLVNAKTSEAVNHDEWFGRDEKKEVKRKKVSGSRAKTVNG
jgi:hypothetical protein